MLINESVNNVYASTDYKKEVKPETKGKEVADKVKPEAETKAATVELGAKEEKEVTYKKPGDTKVDRKAIDRMIEEGNRKMENFKNLIRSLIEKQGGTVKAALSGNFLVEIDEATRLEAAEAVSEDGEFGVAQTADRIVSFAKALAGGDPSKIGVLRKAIQQGFDEAEKILGELPEVSKQTHKEVMRQLDEWAGIGEE